MASANGFVLEVGGYEIRAAWPAPYFALVFDDCDEPGEPWLIHCDSLEHAQAKGGIILNSVFERI